MTLTQINQIQIPTWRWLSMNETSVKIDANLNLAYHGGELTAAEPLIQRHFFASTEIPNLPADLERLRSFVTTHQNWALSLTIGRGVRCDTPIVLDFVLDEESPVLIDHLEIHGEADSQATVVVRYRRRGQTACFHGGFAAVWAEEGAVVRLIKIQELGDSDTHVDGTAITVGERGDGSVLFCELGGAQVVGSANISLAGEESRGGIDGMYLARDGCIQDFDYRLELRGRGGEGRIICRGALAGAASKTMKSTLDFIRGADGAKGREEETVLALSDRAINRSIPLLLCGEDNVEGAHATSTGRLDPLKLHYLMSRGLSRQEAMRVMVEASFTPLVDLLPTIDLRGEVRQRIREAFDDAH
ncbi:MAG: SufD family Fe-S cluster assembly protein [Sphaerochaeta sp.]|nr:SufD family Fe-S cluster assembly protein [Sphaerochaeta sp.]